MIFAKSSTRTRVSFEAGMAQLGGHAMFLSPRGYATGPWGTGGRQRPGDIVHGRYRHDTYLWPRHCRAFCSSFFSVPVINALTDDYHPCQLLADMQTWVEQSRQHSRQARMLGGRRQQYVPVLHQRGARQFDFELSIACPPGFEPDSSNCWPVTGTGCSIEHDPATACSERTDLVVTTDVWASMGQESEQRERAATVRALPGQCRVN